MSLPKDAAARKAIPIGTGVLDYFPKALSAVAEVSRIGNDQHNPGQPLHWAREKSTDEADALIRHFLERGTTDSDGGRHSAKMAWRALALLEKEIETCQAATTQSMPRNSKRRPAKSRSGRSATAPATKWKKPGRSTRAMGKTSTTLNLSRAAVLARLQTSGSALATRTGLREISMQKRGPSEKTGL